MSALDITIRRVHDVLDEPADATAHRVLVDRLWPRGIAKGRLALDDWNKDVAPTPDLRRAFHSGELDFERFREHYLRELDSSDAPAVLLETAREQSVQQVVLLYAAKDREHNHALVLQEHLEAL